MGATTSSRSGVFSAAYRAFRKCSGAVVVALTAAVPLQALAQQAICYNCIPEWADWGTQLKTIKSTTGITVPPDNKNSGQALAQMIAERASPVADFSYMDVRQMTSSVPQLLVQFSDTHIKEPGRLAYAKADTAAGLSRGVEWVNRQRHAEEDPCRAGQAVGP